MRVIVLLSGGLDSTTLGAWHHQRGDEVHALSVHYGQRHAKELDAARAVAAWYGWRHDIVDLSAVGALLTGSSQTDPAVAVPHGHYAAETMKLTVVPNRNAMLLAVATAVAVARHAGAVSYAAHAGDHFVYPDCRPEFVDAFEVAMRLGNVGFGDPALALVRPFITRTKTDIAALANALGVPTYLTWSCYEGGLVHCGRCGTCVERKEALGADDPTVYAA